MMSVLSAKRVWSLVELMELVLLRFYHCLDFMRHEESRPDFGLIPFEFKKDSTAEIAAGLLGRPPQGVSDENKKAMEGTLQFVEQTSTMLEMGGALDRIRRFQQRLKGYISPEDYRTEAKVLREALEDGAKDHFCFPVKRKRADLILRLTKDWAPVAKSFKSAIPDVLDALEAYAIGLNTACVFHLMRVTEIGLRALAKERGVRLPKNKPIEWANWNDIIIAARKQAEQFKNRRAGPARDKAVQFYEGVLGEFEAFKDVYRNDVMHARVRYDSPQAESVILHVREFMNRMSDKLTENPKAIKWGRI